MKRVILLCILLSSVQLISEETRELPQPEAWFVQLGKGVSLLELGKAKEAEKFFRLAKKEASAKESAIVDYHLGLSLMTQNKTAADLMKPYADKKEKSADIVLLHVRALLQEKRKTEAKEALWKVWQHGDSVMKTVAKDYLVHMPLTDLERKKLAPRSLGESPEMNNDHLLHAKRLKNGKLMP